MRLPDDDELYEVDQTYLGPPGRYIAPMRHKAIFAWIVLGPMMFVILRRVGMPMTLLSVGLLLMFSIWAAMTVADHISSESPIGAVAVAFWHDLTTPRPRRTQVARPGIAFVRVARPRGVWARVQRRRAARASNSTTNKEVAPDEAAVQ